MEVRSKCEAILKISPVLIYIGDYTYRLARICDK